MIVLVLTAIAALPAIDCCFRMLLLVASRRRTDVRPMRAETPDWLVVIPSRDEGEHVRRTIESVRRAGARALLLLDGADGVAGSIARELGAEVVNKEPAGPTKAAALAWLATAQRERLLAAGALLLLDVGSILGDDFFGAIEWPADADAVQARLRGAGSGVGVAVTASEALAQLDEDRGRAALGWSVRLRGTGSAFRPDVFLAVMPDVRTRVEDLEATLLMIAGGKRVALGGPAAFVIDEKPSTISSAASQRARWLLGRYQVLVQRSGAFVRAFVRRPAETTALLFEIFGRPLSLTIPFRAVVAVVAIANGLAIAWAILATAVLDIAVVFASGRTTVGSALRLVIAWLLAVVLAPRALFRWMRAKRS